MQNFPPIGKAPTQKSVTVQNKKSHSKLSIPPCTTYGEINISDCGQKTEIILFHM